MFEIIVDDLKHTPYKRLKFFTIRDPKGELVKIGKVYDYLKRFSEKIYLVKSPVGGIHFHALVVLKPDRKVSYKKGIHIKVQDVGDQYDWDPESVKDRQEEAAELAQEAFDYTGDLKHATEIYTQALAPPSKAYQRTARLLAKTRKQKHLTRLSQYLQKNLEENVEPYCIYEHFICPVINKKNI